jgi:TRAP-type C4-dicarboxylate transport system substrate-binding protein
MGKKHIKRQIKLIRQLIFPFVQIILMFQTAFISPVAFANAKFRCASIAPKGSSFEKILQDISDKIKEKTGVEIVFFSGSIVGDEIDIAKDLKNRKYDCAVLTAQGLGFISSYFTMLELPFMIKNEKEADLMRKRLSKAFREILTSQGYIFGGIVEVGFDNFFSKFPITTLKDFAGKGFWVWKDNKIHEGIFKNVMKNLGVKSVVVPIWDIEKFGKEIDIVWAPPSVVLAFGWYRFVNYIIEPPFKYLLAGIIISKTKFDSLPQQIQNDLIDIIESLTEEATLKIRKENQESKKFMLSKLGFQTSYLKDVDELEKLFREYMWPEFKEKYIPSWFFISVMTEILKLRSGQ